MAYRPPPEAMESEVRYISDMDDLRKANLRNVTAPLSYAWPILDAHIHDTDSRGFFEVGRDYEPSNVFHNFTDAEKERMQSFETINIRRANSLVYKESLEGQTPAERRRLNTGRWLIFALIGVVVGLLAFVVGQSIQALSEVRVDTVQELVIQRSNWGFVLWVSIAGLFSLISAALVVVVMPPAGGSGVPEVMAYLNGVSVPHVFNIHTLYTKFASVIFAVASGLPLGAEGPMVHMGGAVGSGVSQGRSKTLGCRVPFFQPFRNSEDRRAFVTGGAAAGVAAAFGAPVGGLLFVMEELASFWTVQMSWMVFGCTTAATFTMFLFSSAFYAWVPVGRFGFFDQETDVLFEVDKIVSFSVAALIPTVIIGLVCGVLGALFTFANVKVIRFRNKYIRDNRVLRAVEPCVVAVIFAVVMWLLPLGFSCAKIAEFDEAPKELEQVQFYCKGGEYSPLASLTIQTGEEALKTLLSRSTAGLFSYGPLFTYLIVYFVFAVYIAGSAVSSGIVMPILLIGSLIGRIMGLALIDVFGMRADWMDPGVFALVAAGAMFAGVSRLTVSLTVILLEISNDIHLLLPIMLAVLIAKWVADWVTHSLYHAVLEIKCIPFLDVLPEVNGIECHTVSSVMAAPLVKFNRYTRVSELVHVLQDCVHHGFPVVSHRRDPAKQGRFLGLILREQLLVLLQHREVFVDDVGAVASARLDFAEMEEEMLGNSLTEVDIDLNDMELMKYVDLGPYMDMAAVTVRPEHSVVSTYHLFRSQGLRHITVVDRSGVPRGIVTRKDLLGQTINEKIEHRNWRSELPADADPDASETTDSL